jgi:hypothetical protein
MAAQRTIHTARQNTTMMIGFATLIAAALTVALFAALRSPVPAEFSTQSSVGPQSVPIASTTMPRLFADEVAGASTEYHNPVDITGVLPERLQDRRHSMTTFEARPQTRRTTGNRIFDDEIAARSASQGEMGVDVEVAETHVQHGPR